MLNYLISLAVTIVYGIIAEYVGHRWVMHRPLLGWRNSIYRNHSVEHHGHSRVDTNIYMDPFTVAIVGLPLLGLMPVLGNSIVFTLCGFSVLYSIVWSLLHSAFHGVSPRGFSWVSKLPGYKLWRDYHLRHHDYPNKNFGTVFIYSDVLFGTYSKP